jgi:glycerol kinase
MAKLILAIDVGTTSTRAGVVRADGRITGLATAPLISTIPRPHCVEQDAEAVWQATRRVMAEALEKAGRTANDIAAIGVTTQRSSAVAWDRTTGRPLSPLVIWSDLRGVANAARLQHAGYPVAPQQSATKLDMMLAEIDAPKDRIAWGNIDSFVIWRLTGGRAHVTDRSQAWPSGYLALPELTWNARLIEHQGLDAGCFPKLVDSWGPMGVTDAEVFGAAVAITADIADQQASLIAHGQEPGTAKFTCGTSATFNLATGGAFTFLGPTAPPLLVSSVEGQTRWCVEGMVLSAGSALDWLRSACALGDHQRFETLAGSVENAAGAAFLPALQGLGSPHGDHHRRAALRNLTGAVTQAHLARAGLEGVAFRGREVMEHIHGLTAYTPPDALGVDGGLTANASFLQVLADLLGRPVRRHATPEATLLGAAIAAGRGAGMLGESDAKAMIRYDPPVMPKIGADEAAERFAAWRGAVYG